MMKKKEKSYSDKISDLKQAMFWYSILTLVCFLETYFREKDPTNPLRPTVVLSWLEGYTSLVSPWLQDGVAVVHGVVQLVVSPLKGVLETGVEAMIKMRPHELVFVIYFCVLGLVVVNILKERLDGGSKKEVQQVDTAVFYEGGKMLKLQAEKTRLEAEVDRLLKEEDLKTKKKTGNYLDTKSFMEAKERLLNSETKLRIAQKVQEERQKVWGEETN